MKTHLLIKKLEDSTKAVFTISDFYKILNKDEGYTKVFINRLVKKNLITRIEKNKYTLSNTNPFLLSSNLIFPSYVSFLSAYSYYNLTTQLPRKFYAVCLKQKKPINSNENLLTFVKFTKERFFGFKREILENKILFVAEVEKAIVDSLYLPEYSSVSETFFAMNNSDFNQKRLLEYAKKMNSYAVLKRLAYLLDLMGEDVTIKIFSKNFVLLNPFYPAKGEKNKKWRVIVNEVLE